MSLQKLKKLFLNATDTLSNTDIIRAINNIQENIANTVNPLIKVQNDASNLTNIELTAGQVNIINHKLGRKLLGYNVMLKGTSPQAIISNNQDNNPSPQLTLWLWTSHDATIDLQIY